MPTIDDYEIIETLGQGGFGCAFKVLRKVDQTIAALKTINIGGVLNDEIKMEEIRKEASRTASLLIYMIFQMLTGSFDG